MKNLFFLFLLLIYISCGNLISNKSNEFESDWRIPEEAAIKQKCIFIPNITDGFLAGIAWCQVVHNDKIALKSKVEVDYLKFYAVLDDGSNVLLNEDNYYKWDCNNQGGLYIRYPWFPSGDYHEPMPAETKNSTLIFMPNVRNYRVWHWWCSKRSLIHENYDYVYLQIKIKLSGGSCFQAGIDWHKSTVSIPEWNKTLKEAAVSDWYFGCDGWIIVTLSTKKNK